MAIGPIRVACTRALLLVVVGTLGTACPTASSQDAFVAERSRMVSEQIARRGVEDPRVLAALQRVPRHLFVPPDLQPLAYFDRPLFIGHEQTISQPYIVALMTELVRPRSTDRALEVGTGSGYQAAVLSTLVDRIYSVEIVEPLALEAARRLKALGYDNVTVRTGDGYGGWPERAPFDIIVVTAAPDHLPQPLVEQLKRGGRMVIPVGPTFGGQELLLIEKDASGHVQTRRVAPVMFVPLRRQE